MKLTQFVVMILAAFALMAEPQASTSPAKTPVNAAATKATSAALVDINSASADELSALSGIGKAYCGKVIKGRPYKGKNELLDKKILPASVYAQIKDQIVAGQK